MLKGLYPQLVQKVIKMPTLKAGLSRSTQLPRRIYFNGQKNEGFKVYCLIQYEKISCCQAATACYSSLGQLLAPELSAPWFRGSSLAEQGRFWWLQREDRPLNEPLHPTLPTAAQETTRWSETGRFFRWKWLLAPAEKNMRRFLPASVLCWNPWRSLQAFAACRRPFQQKPGPWGVCHLTNGVLGKVTHAEQIHKQINHSLFYELLGDCVLRSMHISSSKQIEVKAGTNLAF